MIRPEKSGRPQGTGGRGKGTPMTGEEAARLYVASVTLGATASALGKSLEGRGVMRMAEILMESADRRSPSPALEALAQSEPDELRARRDDQPTQQPACRPA